MDVRELAGRKRVQAIGGSSRFAQRIELMSRDHTDEPFRRADQVCGRIVVASPPPCLINRVVRRP